MKRIRKILKLKTLNFYDFMWLIMPVLVWFSYYPNIHFGQDSTMNFEISLPLIGLLALAVASLPRVWRYQHELVKSKLVWAVSGLVLYSTATMLWSVNLTRSFLTVGIMLLLFIVFLGAVAQKDRLVRLLPTIAKVFVVLAAAMSVLAIIQFMLGVWLPQEVTLLCNGCVVQQFGFPRPNVFAIEPQFLGSLLLAPILVVAHRFLSGKTNRWEVVALGVMLLAMFLTMSRGAIYALALGMIILLIVNRKQFKRIAAMTAVALVTFALSLTLQGGAAATSPVVSESFWGGVSKSINQMTFGVVDIRVTTPPVGVANETVEKELPVFDGYVEESTEIRANRTELALEAWGKDLPTMVFGVGIGGAGVAMHQANPEAIGAREIVQNEYVERLLERGLIGLALSVIIIGLIVYNLRHTRWLWSIVAAFLLQWMLFSGYPNALHIYLILIVLGVAAIPSLLIVKRNIQ